MFIIVNKNDGEVIAIAYSWYEATNIVRANSNTKWEYLEVKMWCEI